MKYYSDTLDKLFETEKELKSGRRRKGEKRRG